MDIELVIKIPEEMYNHMKMLDEHGMSSDAIKTILNGTPLTENTDAISRAEVLDLCESKDPDYKVIHFKEDVECLPSVSTEKTGRWIFDEKIDKHYYCSECKAMGVDYFDYCPYCGAKMGVEE